MYYKWSNSIGNNGKFLHMCKCYNRKSHKGRNVFMLRNMSSRKLCIA